MSATLMQTRDPRSSSQVASPAPARDAGALAVPPSAVVSFTRGLFGFPDHHAFALVATVHQGFYWLRSVDDPALTLLVADPFHHFPGHALDVSSDVLAAIEAVTPSDVLVLVVVTLGGNASATANLQGPVAFNLRVGLAQQFVVSDPAAELRAPLALPRSAA